MKDLSDLIVGFTREAWETEANTAESLSEKDLTMKVRFTNGKRLTCSEVKRSCKLWSGELT